MVFLVSFFFIQNYFGEIHAMWLYHDLLFISLCSLLLTVILWTFMDVCSKARTQASLDRCLEVIFPGYTCAYFSILFGDTDYFLECSTSVHHHHSGGEPHCSIFLPTLGISSYFNFSSRSVHFPHDFNLQ